MSIAPADMLLFAAVARAGSFTHAARELGITKQTASERIAKLEQRLGVRLLERTTRRMRLTDAGSVYFERCSAIAADIDEANRAVQNLAVEPKGLLRVSAPVLYGRHFLAPVVADYLQRFPDMRVEIVLVDRRVALVEEGIDLAIRIGDLDDSSLTARKLGDGHLYCVASPAFLKRHGTPTPASLKATRCVGQQPVETWEVAGVRHKLQPVFVVNDHEVACAAAIAGVGVARLPALVCREAVADGRLRVLFEPVPAQRRPVFVVFPSRHPPAKVRVFIDALAALVTPMLPLERPPARGRTRASE